MASYAAALAEVERSPKDVAKIATLLKVVRAQQLRVPRVVATHGASALADARAAAKLGDDVWSVYEQTLVAALDVDDEALAETCETAILARFDGSSTPSQRVERLKGLIAEAEGDWDEALARYAALLENNGANAAALKREICVLKGKGAPPDKVAAALNGYLAKFQSDAGAWQALAETHAAALRFPDAIFCYEELQLFDPMAQHYQRRLGELYYSWAAGLGSAKADAKYRRARKYFARSLELHKRDNARAATGLLLTCHALARDVRKGEPDADDALNEALGALAASSLKDAYKKAAPACSAANAAFVKAHAPPYKAAAAAPAAPAAPSAPAAEAG